MAGRVVVSTLNDDTGVLNTQNGMTGIAKAWLYYNGSTQTIIGSFNVSSVTRNGSGDYTMNFTTAMPNATYSSLPTAGGAGISGAVAADGATARTTTVFRFYTLTSNGSLADSPFISVAILSS